MKEQLKHLIQQAISHLKKNNELKFEAEIEIQIDRTRDEKHGDFASNIALLLAKPAKKNPRELAQRIVDLLPSSDIVQRVEVAGSGFINFYLSMKAFHPVIPQVLKQAADYGKSQAGAGEKVMVEFVSANPTGPLHVGHGRGAAYGAVVADLLAAIGYEVHREYYVNDAGRQMDILATSVWLRYLELCEVEVIFPKNAYRGEYVKEIASTLKQQFGTAFCDLSEKIFSDLPLDEQVDGSGDKEAYIDALIQRAKFLLGEENYRHIFSASLTTILNDIRNDLAEFGVDYQEWFYESGLKETGAIDREMKTLDAAGYLYKKDGAIWFRAKQFGDEKDRVLVRENGSPTYFASDIAYHLHKFERGFKKIIDVLGADHHGYISRVKASMQALGKDPDDVIVLFVQFAILYRGKERVQMSTRSGSFVTLRELREEVGNDAARFFYVLRKSEQHMDFDLDLAKSQSNDNPVYYIQYAYARICSVFRQLTEKKLSWSSDNALNFLDSLQEPHEKILMLDLLRYPEIIHNAAMQYEPHQLANYLRELAQNFHVYYNATPFIVAEENIRHARLALCTAVKQVLHNGLTLLGVSTPEQM